MEKAKFVEDSLEKSLSDMFCLGISNLEPNKD